MADDIMQGDSPLLSTEILANMSHELRGPLASIKGYAATLRRHEQHLPPEECHAFLQAIEEASDRLAVLLDRFFELSQLEAVTLPLPSERQQFPTSLHPTLLDGQRSPTPPAEQQDFSGFEICICDHGIGIADEHLEHIFERFYRIDTRLVREVNGLGVGLTICKYIIEMHGGHIWVESQVGQGSIFHLWFPAYQLSYDNKT